MKNLKYFVYQKLCLIFPGYFRKKMFGGLSKSLETGSNIAEKEILILHHFAKSDMTFVDVGANNGLYSYYFRYIIGSRSVYAYEPIPALFQKLRVWFRDIQVLPYAISDTVEEKTLKIPYIRSVRFDTRAKLDNDLVEVGENYVRSIQVESKTLDSLFFDTQIKVDFIKMDIEGHELTAIRGARQLLQHDKPILMVEIEARHHSGKLKERVEEVLALGYDCFFLNPDTLRLDSFSTFITDQHQMPGKEPYINNFLFFPVESSFAQDYNSQIPMSL